MTPEDLARLPEEERKLYSLSTDDCGEKYALIFTRLALARRVVEAARAVSNVGDLGDANDLAAWERLASSLVAHDAEVKL